MTLRLRLVLALVALSAVGLTVFGVATYTFYARTQYQGLDETLLKSVPLINGELARSAGLDPGEGRVGQSTRTPNTGRPQGPPDVVPADAYGQLRDAGGTVLETIQLLSTSAQPVLPDPLPRSASGTFLTTASSDGSGDWRVYVGPADRPPGGTVIVALPVSDVTDALHRLVIIELVAAGCVLVMVGSGAWIILRRGLHPLEDMAESAHSITEGELDLSERVAPADDRTEVGQLGLAINTMLGEIEDAFKEREATERRLRQFLSDASHELRTPLTSIQGFAELYRMDSNLDHVNLEVILRRIEEESGRMKALVEDLLLLARLDETRAPASDPVDLAVLAADACSDAVAADAGRSVTLDAPEPVVVPGDADHLRQAIANLVTNAVRHTPEGSPLVVSAHLEHGTGVLTVRDHGPGLDDEALAHVFDRFWQADRARVGTGSGLGLSIVAAIAAEHGGEVTVTNMPGAGEEGANGDAAPDGAAFTLRIPLDRAPATRGATSSPP